MSDYYANPIPIPPNLQSLSATDLASLYSQGGAGLSLPSVGGGGSLTSLLGRAPAALGTFQGPAYLGGTGELGLLGVARAVAPPVIAGQLATAGINAALPSTGGAGNVRQVLGDAATWGGIGAGVGSVIPGVGTAIGGVAGGGAGALYALGDIAGLWGGDSEPSKDDYKTQLAQAATQLGLSPDMYTTAFDLLSKSGADVKTLSGQLAQQLLQDAATKKQTEQAQQLAVQQRAGDQKFALAMQAQAQQFFTPYVNNIITAGQSEAELLKGQAASLPEPYRKVFEAQAEQALAGSQRLAGAYAAQSALLPSQYMYSQDIKRQQELAQLQYQQSVVNAQSGGGNADFSSLVQQLAGQSAGG